MSGTGWGGGMSRRVPGLRDADGAWEIDAVRDRLMQLARRRDELTPRFEQLATRLTEARERLAGGLPPEPLLDTELAAARDAFERLYTDTRALADLLDVDLQQPDGAPTLPDITIALDTIRDGLHAELDRQSRLAETRRNTALLVLDQITRIAYRGPSDEAGFGPLRACQGRANALREAIIAVDLPALHPEVAPLCDGTHPFNHLLNLIDGLPTLDEPDYRRLVNASAADFDEPLARAAGRGLLVADPAATAQ